MKLNPLKIRKTIKKNWITIILMIVIALLLTSCNPTKKLKESERIEEEKQEVFKVEEKKEADKTTDTKSNSEQKKEIVADVVIMADEIVIDEKGNIHAKGNVNANTSLKSTEKTTSENITKEVEKIKEDKRGVSAKTEVVKVQKTKKDKESRVTLGFNALALVIAIILFYFLYRKVKKNKSYFRF